MKNALIIIFLVFSRIASATDYYISLSGNDINNNGLSSSTPWKTIAKVNSAFLIMKPGDRILFKRGDTFYGTIAVTKSGSSGKPITIGAYGAGADPIITGFTTISEWTNEGNGIYSKVIASEAQINMVTINGINIGMGRYPNSTYLTYESFSTNTSITDKGLGDATNWTGAEAVIRKNDWTLDRCTITNHTGDIITYTSLGTNQNASANFGYYIQNDLRTLDASGEWYYNAKSSTFYMYLGNKTPGNFKVDVSTIDNLIYNYGYDYITIDNISFKGSNKSAIYFTGYYADNSTIQNCSINFSGNDGIYLEGCRNTIVNNNYINHSSKAGIYALNGGNNNITNNTIHNSGLIGGLANSGTEGDGIFFIQSQVENAPQHSLIQYNNIDSSGYNGIYFNGNSIEIRNNFINNSVLLLNDGGGIYTGNGDITARIIDGNIVLNSFGEKDGTSDSISLARGIYLDEYASNIIVRNNTVANCSHYGIILHKAHDNLIQDNTSFNNYAGIGFENWTSSNTIFGNIITGNVFFARTTFQYALSFSSMASDIYGFGTADNNYYTRPIDDDDVFYTYQKFTGSKNRTLAEWQSFTNQDANSHKSPIIIPNDGETNIDNYIHFLYNPFKSNVDYDAKGNYIDVTGKKYFKFSLKPYTSVILLKTTDTQEKILGPTYSIFVYPNPAINMLNVLVPGIRDKETILIIDITGKIILEENIEFGQSLVNVSSLPKGMYLVLLKGIKSIAPGKFIKN